MNNLAINPSVAFGRNNQKAENSEAPKKSNFKRNLAIGTAVVGTAAAVTAGVIYRKNLSEFVKSGLGKMKNLFAKKKTPATIFDTTPGYSKETKKLIKDEILNMFSNETIAAKKAARSAELKKMRFEAMNAFKNMKVDA